MNKRMIVDTGMLISFLMILDYRFVRNFGHEMLAILFFLLFLLHTWFNRQWYTSLARGRWNTDRKLTFLSDMLLLLSFAAVMGSGFMISHVLPTGMEKAPRLAHQVHHVAGYVMLIAMGFHLGLHWSAILPRMERAWTLAKSPIFPWHTSCCSFSSQREAFISPLLQHRKQAPSSAYPQCQGHSCHPLDFYAGPPSHSFPLCSSRLLCAATLPPEKETFPPVMDSKNRSGLPFLFYYAYFSSPFQ